MPATPLAENTPWPVAPWGAAYATWAENDAWFSGEVAQLERVAQGKGRAAYAVRPQPGVAGRVLRALKPSFWGHKPEDGDDSLRLHIPAAADIASLSADLLFSDPPDLFYPTPDVQTQPQQVGTGLVLPNGQPASSLLQRPTASAQQQRLEQIASSAQAHAAYLEGGAYASAFGAAAFRLSFDQATSDRVWFDPVAPDATIPEFRFGKLSAVTFWTEYRAGSLFYRHLERHESGFISHTLYLGTEVNLGRVVPLQTRPETEPLIGLPGTTMDGLSLVAPTGISRLTAAWWINQPARSWRREGPLAEAGRSDYAGGTKSLFDALDAAWSSWMTDLELGRARLIVPSAYLSSTGRGQGAEFDTQRRIYSPLTSPGQAGGSLSDNIEQVQFAIRVLEHEQTTQALYRRILGSAGLGELDKETAQSGTGQRTATEVNQEGDSKERTRRRKALYASMALQDLLQTAMLLDGSKFPGKGGGDYEPPTVEFPQESSVDPLQNAQAIQYLRSAKVMSVWEGVARANPGWKDQDIQIEVDRLKQEGAIADPATAGNPAQDPREAVANLPNVDEAARRLGLEVTGG